MRNWLVLLLGGCTEQDWSETQKENARIQGARDSEVAWLRSALENSQAHEAHLQDIIFKRFGIVVPEGAVQHNANPNPVEINRGGWGKQKQRLERADLERHLNALEAQYTGRSTPMPPGNSTGEDSSEHIPSGAQMGD